MSDPSRAPMRWLAAAGALLAAAAVALSAYAAHAAQGEAQARLFTAAVFAFGHGIALAALAPVARRRLAAIALAGLLLGTLLFCGGVVVRQTLGVSLGVAPLGGGLLVLSWLLYAAAALRR